MEQNDYLSLYKSKVKQGSLAHYAVQVGYLHNALGQVIKELVLMINLDSKQNSNLNSNFIIKENGIESQLQPVKNLNIFKIDAPKNAILQSGTNYDEYKYEKPAKVATKQFFHFPAKQNHFQNKKKDQISSSSSNNGFSQMNDKIQTLRREKPQQNFTLDSYLSKRTNVWDNEQQKVPKKTVYRQGKKHNHSADDLQGVDCEMCQKFYGAFQGNNGKSQLCKHSSKHQTTAPFTKIKSFSQQFQDDL